jgi:hypothetical protein
MTPDEKSELDRLRDRNAQLSSEVERLLHLNQWIEKREEYYAEQERLSKLCSKANEEIARLRDENRLLRLQGELGAEGAGRE